jgi:hypothetical protein
VLRDINNRHGVAGSRYLLGGALVTLATHLVGVPPIVAHKLEAFLRDVLGDGCYEVARGENLEVALDLHVHSRTVDDRAVEAAPVRLVDLHLIQGERVADDILGETLDILTLLRQYPAAPVDIETRMHPATQHPGTLRRKQTLVEEKRDHAGPEQLFQRLEADIGQ